MESENYNKRHNTFLADDLAGFDYSDPIKLCIFIPVPIHCSSGRLLTLLWLGIGSPRVVTMASLSSI